MIFNFLKNSQPFLNDIIKALTAGNLRFFPCIIFLEVSTSIYILVIIFPQSPECGCTILTANLKLNLEILSFILRCNRIYNFVFLLEFLLLFIIL